MNSESKEYRPYESGDVSKKGHHHEEAKQFIVFCVELDNQDDRLKTTTRILRQE